jgi:beta-glucosidase
MPWASKVKSILQMWYPGDKGGYATANLLLGKTNPGGRLPFTWPKSLGQEVAHQPAAHPERTSTGVNGVTTYSEGVDIGYRFFDATNEVPRYPFGYGLSYTTFAYSGLRTASAADGGVNVTINVRNTGAVAGDGVAQVYLGAPDTPPSGVQFAPKALAAYARVTLSPGQTKAVTLHVPVRQLQYWSTTRGWSTATGTRRLIVGPDERTPALSTTVAIGGASQYTQESAPLARVVRPTG